MEEKKWTESELEEAYAKIKQHEPEQEENYKKFLEKAGEEQIEKWKKLAENLGLELEIESGRIKYKKDFKPLEINAEICYIRHGKTLGNTEPRVYQGQVDYPNNQLTDVGLQQAAAAAEKLFLLLQEEKDKFNGIDLIVFSPLQRAKETGKKFAEKNKDIPFTVLAEAAEMRFGGWDNEKVINLPPSNICHLFYLKQNAIVKDSNPHVINKEKWISPEWLQGKEKVVVYGHSMAGAAVSILLGFGKADKSGFLGFDGSFIMPNATPTLLIPKP